MKKNTSSFFVLSILVPVVMLSGCEMIFPPVTYEATPTRISYDLSYGYRMNTTGTGRYELTYFCDIPEVLIGTTSYSMLSNIDYQTKNLFNNTVIHWNISGKNAKTFELGITTKIEVESYLVADLNGKDALTIRQIHDRYPALASQYTRLQANETIRFIDPSDPDIMTIADAVYTNEKTNNSFLVAKSLFSWLKQNIAYQIHPDERVVRSASVTLSNKQGDCDDLSFLYISLCRAVDIPARFIRGYLITDGINGSITATPHAWTEVFVGQPGSLSGWIPIECACCTNSLITDINQNFGVESAFHLRLFTDDGSNASLAFSLSGISYITHEQNTSIALESFAEIRNYQELESKKLIITEKNNRYYE
jgi:transglutaminase-like putative cysteine protease